MTVIVAIESTDHVVIGCDSAISSGDWKDSSDRAKYRDVGCGLVVATSGAMRFANALQAVVPAKAKRKRDEGDVAYLTRAYLSRARKAIASLDKVDDEASWSALIVYENRVYDITSDFGLQRAGSGYAAIGSGYAYAYGSLATTVDDPSPMARVHAALNAAIKHSPTCAGPVHTTRIDRHNTCEDAKA
jgi:ATP-dependent protease HslVU (ClpYQ) peptidase subunit